MKIKKSCCFIVILLLISIKFSSTAFAETTNGQKTNGAVPYTQLLNIGGYLKVIIGNLAFDLNYANDSANQDEITQAVINSNGKIYIITMENKIVDNNTNQTIDYTDPRVYGKLVKYKDSSSGSGMTFDTYIVAPPQN